MEATNMFNGLEEAATEVIDVCRLVAKNLAGEALDQLLEILWDRERLNVSTCHYFKLYN
jgi:hypothetical protein